MKRFWTDVSVADRAVRLDGRAVLTPARAPLTLPTAALAAAVADEWRAVTDTVDPRAMPMTGLANAAIDRVTPDPARFAGDLAAYGESELFCYRADAPPRFVARQAAVWDPLLAAAATRWDVAFTVTTGVMHVAQPPATVARLRAATAARDAFALAGLSPLVTIGGSLVAALLVADERLDPDAAFAATHLDEAWQAEMWGEDALATATRAARQRDFASGARFLRMLDDD